MLISWTLKLQVFFKNLVPNFLLFFSVVFAYGATGAGKTFTMKGSMQEPGIMFHTMMELYRRFDVVRNEKTCDVAISYLEVCEKTVTNPN